MKCELYKTREFGILSLNARLSNADLVKAIEEIEAGLVDANLGGGLFKKRVARQGSGKSGGYRVIVALKVADRAFLLDLYAKNEQANIPSDRLTSLKIIAQSLLNAPQSALDQLLRNGSLERIE